jgi:site-specific recombinase XerD
MTPDERLVPALCDEHLRKLLAACAGKTFEARRDTALIVFLLDTGTRRSEIMGIRPEELDFDLEVAGVHGKGRRDRAVPFGRTTAVAIDRYLRAQVRHKHAGLP